MDESLQHAMQRLPAVREWIQGTLRQHKADARPASELGFERLPLYFPSGLLDKAHVVLIEQVPTVPMTSLGLPELAAFEHMNPIGITYDNTCFVRESCSGIESLHFHELIHVVQWRHLGFDSFIIAYAAGLVLYGYDEHPLEVQACRHERRFNELEDPYDAEREASEELPCIVDSLMSGGL